MDDLPQNVFEINIFPFEAPAEGRRPEGEGANLDRRLVLYPRNTSESNLATSLFIYIYICMVHCPFCDGLQRLGTG